MNPLLENPFFVLDLGADATPIEVERQGRKLLHMLELGLAAAAMYATPVGPRARTAEAVRTAMQTLLDPVRRLPFEPWAAAPRADTATSTTATNTTATNTTATNTFAGLPGGLAWWQR
jgi:hypothetical protein